MEEIWTVDFVFRKVESFKRRRETPFRRIEFDEVVG